MPLSEADLEDLQARLIARAWLDDAFRTLLLSDADAAARAEWEAMPEDVHLHVVASEAELPAEADAFTFVLPPNPFARRPNPLFAGLLNKTS